MHLKVTSQEWLPFVDFYKNGNDKLRIKGVLGNLLNEVCLHLNATYEVVRADGPESVMIDLLNKEEVDFILALVEINSKRFSKLNFTVPLFASPKTIISKHGDLLTEDVLDSFRGINPVMWILLISVASVIPVLFWISELVTRDKKPFSRVLWNVLTLCLRQSINEGRIPASGTILIGTVLLTVLLTTTIISCYINTSLVVKHEGSLIDSLEDLAKFDHITPTFFRDDTVDIYFQSSTDEVIKILRERVMADEYNLIVHNVFYSKAFAEKIAKGTHVYITETFDIPNTASVICNYCPWSFLHVSKETFALTSYSAVFGKTLSPEIKMKINNIIIRLHNGGFLYQWLKVAAGQEVKCLVGEHRRQELGGEFQDEVSFDLIDRIFLIWLIGIGLSIIVFCIEFLTVYANRCVKKVVL